MPIQEIIESFKDLTALVVGDVMIDSYLWGKVERMSPEAPNVPVVSIEKRNARAGGAANVAKNIKALGAKAIMCSVVGTDNSGTQLIQILKDQDISIDALVQSAERKTTVKTRVISDDKHVLRVDDEEIEDISKQLEDELLERIEHELKRADVVILEDYNKGVLTQRLIARIVEMAQNANVPVTVDPKKKNFLAYKGVHLFKPNFKELCEGTDSKIKAGDKDGIEKAVNSLRAELANEATMVTLSEHGVFIENGTERHFLAAHERNVIDVSGAGDSVIATASLALAAGANLQTIAALSNLAGGIVCEQVGVVPIKRSVLQEQALQLLERT